jgi:hypothetical protein
MFNALSLFPLLPRGFRAPARNLLPDPAPSRKEEAPLSSVFEASTWASTPSFWLDVRPSLLSLVRRLDFRLLDGRTPSLLLDRPGESWSPLVVLVSERRVASVLLELDRCGPSWLFDLAIKR